MRTWRLSAGALAVVLLAGSAWWLVEDRAGSGRDCALVSTPLRDPGDALVPVEALLPRGTVGDQRRVLVDEAERVATRLGLGRVLAGRFYDGAAPAVVPLGAALSGHALLAAPAVPGTDRPVLSAVRLTDGATTWAREFDGVLPGGGLVGDDLVLLGSGADGTPVALTLAPEDGTVHRCQDVGDPAADGRGRILADQAGERVVVVTGEVARPGRVTLLDPRTGTVWTRPVDGLPDVASVTVAGPDGPLLVGRFRDDPVLLAESGQVEGGQLQALDPGDGSPLWTYPGRPRGAVAVAGDDQRTGLVLLLTAQPARASGAHPRMGVEVLDPDGRVRWRRDVGHGFRTAELWDGPGGSDDRMVVVGGRAAGGRLVLQAFGLADGDRRWRLTTPSRGPSDRTALGAGIALDGRYAVPAPAGLLVVDPGTGAARTVRTALPLDGLQLHGELAVLRSGRAILVVGDV